MENSTSNILYTLEENERREYLLEMEHQQHIIDAYEIHFCLTNEILPSDEWFMNIAAHMGYCIQYGITVKNTILQKMWEDPDYPHNIMPVDPVCYHDDEDTVYSTIASSDTVAQSCETVHENEYIYGDGFDDLSSITDMLAIMDFFEQEEQQIAHQNEEAGRIAKPSTLLLHL